jgi:hypothetical protein
LAAACGLSAGGRFEAAAALLAGAALLALGAALLAGAAALLAGGRFWPAVSGSLAVSLTRFGMSL